MGIGNTTPAAALIGLLSSRDAGAVTGRGTGIDDEAWMRKAAAVRDAMRRGRPVRADQIALLATVGGADFAAMTGFLLQAAVRQTPVILDGLVSGACAMVAHRVAYRGAPSGGRPGTVRSSRRTSSCSPDSSSSRCSTTSCASARALAHCSRCRSSARRRRHSPTWPPSTRPGVSDRPHDDVRDDAAASARRRTPHPTTPRPSGARRRPARARHAELSARRAPHDRRPPHLGSGDDLAPARRCGAGGIAWAVAVGVTEAR